MQRRRSGGPIQPTSKQMRSATAQPALGLLTPLQAILQGEKFKVCLLTQHQCTWICQQKYKARLEQRKAPVLPREPPKALQSPTETTQGCKIRLRSHLLPSSRGAKGHGGEPAKCAGRALPAPWLLQSARLFLQSLLAGQDEQGGTCEAGWLPSKEKQMQIFLHFSLGAARG